MAEPTPPARRAERALTVATLAATVAVASLLLPWVHSGSRARNGLETVRAARVLGISHPLLTATLAVPALVGVSWIAAARSRPFVQGLTAAAASAIMLAGALVVRSSALRAGGGAELALAAGTVCAASATLALAARPSSSRGDDT